MLADVTGLVTEAQVLHKHWNHWKCSLQGRLSELPRHPSAMTHSGWWIKPKCHLRPNSLRVACAFYFALQQGHTLTHTSTHRTRYTGTWWSPHARNSYFNTRTRFPGFSSTGPGTIYSSQEQRKSKWRISVTLQWYLGFDTLCTFSIILILLKCCLPTVLVEVWHVTQLFSTVIAVLQFLFGRKLTNLISNTCCPIYQVKV